MKKKIFFDVILSMMATFIPIFGLQFIILPKVAVIVDSESYGQLIWLVSLINLISLTLGGVLNNSKLINYSDYKKLEDSGDFNTIFKYFLLVNIITVGVSLVFYSFTSNIGLVNIMLLILISTLCLSSTYANVEFRINLNYKKILLESVFLSIGYILGYFVFLVTNQWIYIYLFGFSLSFFFVYKNTSTLRERYNKTELYLTTLKKTLMLLLSGILVSLGGYIDKLILYPLLGGTALSIYFVATILGKTISMAIGPISSVILSYLSKYDSFSHSSYRFMFVFISIISTVGYFIITLVSKPILNYIYPQFANEAIMYVNITTIAIMFKIVSSFMNPVILKFSHVKWQLIINSIYLLVYVSLSLVFQSQYGLYGFCVGITISEVVKLILILIVYQINKSKINKSTILAQKS